MRNIISVILVIGLAVSTGLFSVVQASDVFDPSAWVTYSNDPDSSENGVYGAHSFLNA